jgi:hypothetical protein
MLVTSIPHTRGYEISDMVTGYLVTKVYYGYTKDEATADFVAFIRYTKDPSYAKP